METHRCSNSEQQILEIYDEDFENFKSKPFTTDENGNVTGMALCKTKCSTCGEIYLVEVPLLKFTEEEFDEENESDDQDSDE